MKNALRALLISLAAIALRPSLCPAQESGTFHFLVMPSEDARNYRDESFVIRLTAEQKAAVDALKAQGKFAQFSGRIAAGMADFNRNYVQADRPAWNWHVVAVDEIVPAGSLSETSTPEFQAHPTDIATDPARWIAENGDRYTPARYRIGAEFNPASSDKFYYALGSRYILLNPGARIVSDTFVVEVDGVTHARIQELMWLGHQVGVSGHIAAGSVPYNKNYYKPGQPAWNWHFTRITGLRDFTISGIDTMEVNPNRDSSPSVIEADPEQWIRSYGTSYRPKDWAIQRQVAPGEKVLMANVSNRGMTGAGEKALITGLMIKGGEPRSVVLRALGPSMSRAGVQQPAVNPKIEVFSGSERIATNNDWKTNARATTLAEAYPTLVPQDDREAALLLTLMPGTYTLHGTNEDGSEGVVLLEAYDIDSNTD